MAFEDIDWIELRKISLLYGRNSCGKSVLTRAFRLLRQSLTAAESGEPIRFVDEHGVDLGSFKAALHKSPQDKPIKFHKAFANASSWLRPISFGFRCEIPLIDFRDRKDLEWVTLKDAGSTSADDTISFEVSLSFSLNKDKVVIVGFDLWRLGAASGLGERTRCLTLQFDPDLEPHWNGYSATHFPFSGSDAVGSYFDLSCADGFMPALEFNSISDASEIERKQITEIAQVWSLCKEEIRLFLKSIVYVGPIRPFPERYYLINERMRQSLRRQNGDAFLRYLESSESASLQEQIEKWMIEFDLAKSIRHNPTTSKETPDRQVVLRELVISENDYRKEEQAGKFEVNIKDIGFGASQILPVIIACLSSDQNAFIIIEQPELHLHPEAQASTADLFIECVCQLTPKERQLAAKEEKGREERNEERIRERVSRRCLIETHSEHIMVRLQLRIAGGVPERSYALSEGEETASQSTTDFELAGRDLGLMFITRDKSTGKSHLRYIEADPYGRLVGSTSEFSFFFERSFLDSSVFSIASERSAGSVETRGER
jgi:hypothetical protein